MLFIAFLLASVLAALMTWARVRLTNSFAMSASSIPDLLASRFMIWLVLSLTIVFIRLIRAPSSFRLPFNFSKAASSALIDALAGIGRCGKIPGDSERRSGHLELLEMNDKPGLIVVGSDLAAIPFNRRHVRFIEENFVSIFSSFSFFIFFLILYYHSGSFLLPFLSSFASPLIFYF